ncbi:MAG TPA: phage integrase N-terminal SAM-like domain-containing protein [Clostridia bacterium]|nr:phage integrase N-terminal SAM-like domain-containing protein [Clostridia bacterium]
MMVHKSRQLFSGGSAPVGYESVIPNPKSKLLDQMREVMRLKHYSIRTERSYCDWVKRYVRFHEMKLREESAGGAEDGGVSERAGGEGEGG